MPLFKGCFLGGRGYRRAQCNRGIRRYVVHGGPDPLAAEIPDGLTPSNNLLNRQPERTCVGW